MRLKKDIVHCATSEKFINGYVELVEKHFDSSRHIFLVRDRKDYIIKNKGCVVVVRWGRFFLKDFFLYIVALHGAKKIILHGLNDVALMTLLALQPWLLKKCCWVMWGADLYEAFSSIAKPTRWFRGFLRRLIAKRVGCLVTYLPGDYELARKKYLAKGELLECIMYSSNFYVAGMTPVSPKSITTYMVGNSAFASNNHLSALTKLSKLKNKDIRVVCPLSYGDSKYAESIVKKGRELFGERFVPLLDFMSFDDYMEVLREVDVGVFAHDRQQGMGNMIALLGMGKPIYINSNISTWELFQVLGVEVFDVKSLDDGIDVPAFNAKNAAIIKKYFSESQWLKQSELLFEC